MQYATNPTVEWGPFLVKHRAEVEKYRPGFVVDPWGGDVRHNPPATPGERDFVVRIVFRFSPLRVVYEIRNYL